VPDTVPPSLRGLRGDVVVREDVDGCTRALVGELTAHLRLRLEHQPSVHIALSGGSSGTLLCDALAEPETARLIDWQRTHLWMVDERCVADEDPRLNFALFRDRLAPKVPIPTPNLHPMPALAKDGAQHYARALRLALGDSGVFDAIVLGMGGDGHTASLFPGSPALEEREAWVALNDGDRVTPPRPRMTLTYPALNQAKLIAILVTGAAKAQTLREVARHPDAPSRFPVQGIAPGAGSRLLWYLDRAAVPD
jgi:6-phosphogluconolactonase